MNLQHRFLRLENQTSKAEKILDRSMLQLVDVLECPDVDGLVVIGCEDGLLNPVHASIGDDNDVEKVRVEAHQEREMNHGEDREETDQNTVSALGVFDSQSVEDDHGGACDHDRPEKGHAERLH